MYIQVVGLGGRDCQPVISRQSYHAYIARHSDRMIIYHEMFRSCISNRDAFKLYPFIEGEYKRNEQVKLRTRSIFCGLFTKMLMEGATKECCTFICLH